MEQNLLFTLTVFQVLCFSFPASTRSESFSGNDICPLWYHHNSTTGQCDCGDVLAGAVQCNNKTKTVSIKACYCMTLDNIIGEVVVGSCLYTCYHLLDDLEKHMLTNEIKVNTTAGLNNETCEQYNRQGFLCGECKTDYGKPVYSYSIGCVKCSDYKYNWLKYIAVAYLPLTLFYFVIILFKISASSGLMVGYVTISQIAATSNTTIIYLITNMNKYSVVIRILAMIYSVWNLDFFRSIYPPFCLHPDLTALQVLSLDYKVAVYPMMLIFLTYLMVQLYSYNCRLVSFVCKPVYTCLHYFRKEWAIGSSLIDAFATLFLLSYYKILNVSLNILTPNFPYYMNRSHGQLLVYNDPTTPYLSNTHLPFFLLAIGMSFTFNIVPLFLFLMYPTRCFQKCLHRIRLHHRVLHSLMDAFQGSYKLNPHHLRAFSAVFLLAQITNLVLYTLLDNAQYHPGACYMLMVVIVLLSVFKPFKMHSHNVINITLFIAIGLTYYSVVVQLEAMYSNIINQNIWARMNQAVMYLGAFIPPLYGLALLLRRTIPSRRLKLFITHKCSIVNDHENEDNEASVFVPYRLQRKDETVPLIRQI